MSNTYRMRWTLVVVAFGLATAACGAKPEAFDAPAPPPMWAEHVVDRGYPIKPRPSCSAEVRAAHDARTVTELAARGAVFDCGGLDPLPLDNAVMADDPALVRALLKAHADPNARWSDKGDRFPLQETLEPQLHPGPARHRFEIMELLLQHGADPNQRWCPFESRGEDPATACTSKFGITPLILAAARDDAPSAFVLLRAGAEPRLEGQFRNNALDLAHGETVFYMLLSAVVSHGTRADALAYIERRNPHDLYGGPWDDTPLARAVVGALGGVVLPPPPPPSPAGHGELGDVAPAYASDRVGRVSALLALGADPNQRLTGDVDWTPLSLAVTVDDPEVVRALLVRGADVNARWCAPVALDPNRHVLNADPECASAHGITPLMAAASRGSRTVVAAILSGNPDPTLRDWNGLTAFDYAVRARHKEIAAELTQYARFRARFP